MNNEEQNIVSELEEQFGGAIAGIPERVAEQLPKMKCVLLIKNAFLNRSQASGRKQLTIQTEVVESDAGEEFVGKDYKKNWGLETEENFSWLKKDMVALELEPPQSAKDLVPLCAQLEGLCFEAQLAPNVDENFPPNCYINKGARRHELEGGTAKGKSTEL